MEPTYNWYNLFNKTDFLSTGLVLRSLDVFLQNEGEQTILITRGNELGVQYLDTFLILGLNGENPYARDGRAIYLDENDDVWLGIEIAE